MAIKNNNKGRIINKIIGIIKIKYVLQCIYEWLEINNKINIYIICIERIINIKVIFFNVETICRIIKIITYNN